jgi:hypothetical protein
MEADPPALTPASATFAASGADRAARSSIDRLACHVAGTLSMDFGAVHLPGALALQWFSLTHGVNAP